MLPTKKFNYLLLIFFIIIAWFFCVPSLQGQNIQPEITLVWFANTYIPPEYPGKPLPSRGSEIEVVANVTPSLNTKDLIYQWFLNDQPAKTSSAKEKNILKFQMGESITKSYSVSLEIKDQKGNLISKSDYLNLKAYPPELVLKITQPSINYTLPSYQISSQQTASFIAQPYFFDIKSPKELSYQWILEEKTAYQTNKENPHIFTLKVGKINDFLKQTLQIKAWNKNNPLQRDETQIEIILTP